MNAFLNIVLHLGNTGLMAGLTALALLFLRPLLKRVLTAQQRVVLWLVVWVFGLFPLQGRIGLLPVTFQSLVVPRTGELFTADPAFLPASYGGTGTYHVALPGDVILPVTLTDGLLLAAGAVWLAGCAALVLYCWVRGRRLTALVRQGRRLAEDDPLLTGMELNKNELEGRTEVWIAPGLPTSFVRWRWMCNEICIQGELPPERLKLVLRHEVQHVRLWHPWWKVTATVTAVLFWWNPLVWLGFRCFCRDLELACDASVLGKLAPQERKEYARTLVELGCGKQLWEVPLAFGECDAALRVKSAAVWKPRPVLALVLTWAAAAGLVLFFYGGHRVPYPVQDMVLAYQQEYGGMEEFAEQLNRELAAKLGLTTYGAGPEEVPDLGICQVWEAPDDTQTVRTNTGFSAEKGMLYKEQTVLTAALWVQTGDGTWYHASYGWWGEGTGTFGLLRAEECAAPDLTGMYRVY